MIVIVIRQLRVEPEESGEYCALLAGRRETFVDSSLDVDEYSKSKNGMIMNMIEKYDISNKKKYEKTKKHD